MKQGFALLSAASPHGRETEYALRFMLALSVYFTLRLNTLTFCLGQNFTPWVKFRWVFEKGLKKGCSQTFEDLSQKDTIVLP